MGFDPAGEVEGGPAISFARVIHHDIGNGSRKVDRSAELGAAGILVGEVGGVVELDEKTFAGLAEEVTGIDDICFTPTIGLTAVVRLVRRSTFPVCRRLHR